MFALPFLSREALWGLWYLIPYIVHLTLINQYMAVQALHWRGFGMWLVVNLSVSVVCHKDFAWPCMSKQLCDLHWWWDTCYNPCHFPLDDMFSLVPNATNYFSFLRSVDFVPVTVPVKGKKVLLSVIFSLKSLCFVLRPFCSSSSLFFFCTVIVFCCLFW